MLSRWSNWSPIGLQVDSRWKQKSTHMMPLRAIFPSVVVAFFFGAAGFAFQEEPTVNSVEVYMCVTLMRYPSGGGASEIRMR